MQPLHHRAGRGWGAPVCFAKSATYSCSFGSSFLMPQPLVALRIELSVTTLSGSSGQPVLDDRTATTNCARTLSAIGIGNQIAFSTTGRSVSHASATSVGAVLDKGTQPKKKARRLADTGPFWLSKELDQVSSAPIFIAFGCVTSPFIHLLGKCRGPR